MPHPWADHETGTPLMDIRAARSEFAQRHAREATTLRLADDTATVLAAHPSVKEIARYTPRDQQLRPGMPAVLRGLRVEIEAEAPTGWGLT
jgi:hypothetical protein